MQLITIKSLDEMNIWANSFTESLPKNLNRALIVGLSGDLGSGKTTFVQSVANVLGIEKYITSPTFVIQKKYKINSAKVDFENLIHIDAYRLESGRELLDLDWEEVVKNPKNIIFIEWPERVIEILPRDMKKINFKFIDEKTRKIFYEE